MHWAKGRETICHRAKIWTLIWYMRIFNSHITKKQIFRGEKRLNSPSEPAYMARQKKFSNHRPTVTKKVKSKIWINIKWTIQNEMVLYYSMIKHHYIITVKLDLQIHSQYCSEEYLSTHSSPLFHFTCLWHVGRKNTNHNWTQDCKATATGN